MTATLAMRARLGLRGAQVLLNHPNRVVDALDLLHPLFRYLDLEGVFDVDHDLQRRQRVESQRFPIRRGIVNLSRGVTGDADDALSNDAANLLGGHMPWILP